MHGIDGGIQDKVTKPGSYPTQDIDLPRGGEVTSKVEGIISAFAGAFTHVLIASRRILLS